MVHRTLFFICIFLGKSAMAQIQTVAIPQSNGTARPAARTTAIELTLPFWDDFSFTKESYPQDSLWLDGNSVWVNDGLGIHPPSIRVATLDGTDATGKPYNVNDVLAKGYADNLESQVLRIDQVDASLRSSVYISFFYQMKGHGEVPDLGDLLILQFKNADDRWETVWSVENDGTLDPSRFYQVILPIADEKFFHATFQFRFQNFARLSGPYDTWHVDYVYINKGRSFTDLSYPDRSLASTLGSIFPSYRSVPKKHFFSSAAPLVKPQFIVYNLRLDNTQPLNYFTLANITSFQGEEASQQMTTLDEENSVGSVSGGEHKLVEAEAKDLLTLLSEQADSLSIQLTLGLRTKDNLTPADDGDYEAAIFSPIDFRNNDTLRAEYWLSSFYAYDDGSAEYGAALNQPGAMIAYEYNLVGVPFDSIAALDLYFPRFGDESSQVIEIHIWSALTDNPDDLIYREVVTLQRSSQNLFWRKKLTESKRVPSRFYVGWKQANASVIAVGLDKNTDSGNKMFYNTIGTWEQNSQITGSLMLRPVFGKGRKGVETGTEREIQFTTFPNPTQGTFYFTGHASRIRIYDLTGRPVSFEKLNLTDKTQVSLLDAKPGLYIFVREQNGVIKTSKLVVQN